MTWIAWKMLTGNRGKYIGIVLGITFAALLIAQQASIFCGLMLMTTSQIEDITGANIWVMDPNVQFIDDIKPMSDNELMRVRGVPGVAWAVRLYKGLARARFLPEDSAQSLERAGKFQQVILIGLDDATMVGAPQQVTIGSLDDLRQPDAIIMDENGYQQLWPDEPMHIGKVFEMNDRRAILVGICKARKTFQTFPIVYTRYSQAVQYVPSERKVLSFILANSDEHTPVDAVCDRIGQQTGLQAVSRDRFVWQTIDYYMRKTGIPMNFGITVLLGFIVGTAISGQTFYLFTIENLKQFGALKAMGTTNLRLVRMIMFHAAVVGVLGYGLGIGLAALFGAMMEQQSKLAFYMPWQVLVGTGVAIVVMVLMASLLSLRRVLVLEPAVVFQG
ncbi:MAG TPA: ABC transporter permease [Pirellulales bacterium]|nr:ABC transporter permease [Pirellulales bacterium]